MNDHHTILNRRDMLALIGVAGAAQIIGCGSGGPESFAGPYSQQKIAGCVVTPDQTEGPFFVDEKLNRSDIRIDPSNNSVSPGVPLRLMLYVSQVTNNSCTPLQGATVDVWHCDALGSYSDTRDNAAGDTRGKKFLRGYQVSDAQGKVEFLTVYPGWYEDRTVHIHYKVRTNPKSETGHELTSQLYFDDATTDAVHTQAPYAQKGRRETTNATDGIFRRGGNDLMLTLNKDTNGYVGIYKVGLLIG